MELNNDEKILFECLANHFKGIEAVGGKLFITDKKISFISHSLNIQNHTLDISYDHLIDVSFFNSLSVIPNGLKINTSYGTKEKFIVWKRKKIKKLIDEQLHTYKKQH